MGQGQGDKPSPPLTSAFSYALMLEQAAALAAAAGTNSTEAARLTDLAKKVTAQYHHTFYRGNGTYDTGTQTSLALALRLGGSPDIEQVRETLMSSLSTRFLHYSTGIIGFKFLFDVLDAAEQHDAALSVLLQTSYPSIGFYFANELEQASENLWELPDALAEGIGMNSRNHHMWSSYSSYLVRSVGGLGQGHGSAGYKTIEFRPSKHYELRAANVSVELAHGTAALRWVRHGGYQFDHVSEGGSAHLSCGRLGGRIVGVEAA